MPVTSLNSVEPCAMKNLYGSPLDIHVTHVLVTIRQLCEIIKTLKFVEGIHEDDRE